MADTASIAERRDAMVERSFATDPDGLRMAYDAYGSVIHTFCARTLGAHAAQDATQEVFIAAWRDRERFDPERGALVAWLMGIARFRVLGALRTGKRQPTTLAEMPEPVVSDPDAVERLSDRLLVAQALQTLPDRARAAVSMAYLDGLSHQEVAERTGVPLGTVKSDIRRGLERLRRSLAGHDG